MEKFLQFFADVGVPCVLISDEATENLSGRFQGCGAGVNVLKRSSLQLTLPRIMRKSKESGEQFLALLGA